MMANADRERILDVLYVSGPQWGDRKPEDILAALEAAGYEVVPAKKLTAPDREFSSEMERWAENPLLRFKGCDE